MSTNTLRCLSRPGGGECDFEVDEVEHDEEAHPTRGGHPDNIRWKTSKIHREILVCNFCHKRGHGEWTSCTCSKHDDI